MKVKIDFNGMKNTELITLARTAIKAANDVSLDEYKLVKQ